MAQQLSIAEAQSICLRNNIPFYTYRLPGEEEVVFGAQLTDDTALFKGFERHRGEEGFVIAPFNPSSWSFPYLIRPDLKFSDTLTDPAAIVNLQNTMFNTPVESCPLGSFIFNHSGFFLVFLLSQQVINVVCLLMPRI